MSEDSTPVRRCRAIGLTFVIAALLGVGYCGGRTAAAEPSPAPGGSSRPAVGGLADSSPSGGLDNLGQLPPGELAADNLLLIINKQEPAGDRLARHYAEVRHVPVDRIVTIDVPVRDELPYDDFHEKIAPTLRSHLQAAQLSSKVTCLVTFYGVPLRIGPRSNTNTEAAEYQEIEKQVADRTGRAKDAVHTAELIAQQVQPAFKPSSGGDDLPALLKRAEEAVKAVIAKLPSETNAGKREQAFSQLIAAVELLYGPLETKERLATADYQRLSGKTPTPEQQQSTQAAVKRVILEVQSLASKSAVDAAARSRLRELFSSDLGLLRNLQLLSEQKGRLETRETESAFDSELACLWWPNAYLRYRWQESPLNFRNRFAASNRSGATQPAQPAAARFPRTLMVTRLDAPTEARVRQMIDTSVAIEKQGLKGTVALDARGKDLSDAYGKYDETIRDTADALRTHTSLNVRLDNNESLFPERSVPDVALYCGWYSLRNYVPGMTFNPGAIGFHVASLEMVSLHAANERGWCANLLNDGCVATIGPVAEPYLHSFPAPNDLFPLLLTGKLSWAECYWLSNPLVSWMNVCIGDPLYRPYQANAPLKPENVSYRLRVIFEQRQ